MTKEDFHKQYTQPSMPATEQPMTTPEKIGPYKIEALLKKGGMGWLYMGIHPDTKKPIAIKTLPSSCLKDPEAVERFLKESRLIALTDHPNIIKLYEEGRWDGGLYIAMEWIHGIPLRQFIAQQSFSLKCSLDIILQVSQALKHLHSHGIIHRDLKPENILITENGEIKVIDFGIAQVAKEDNRVARPQLIGTPNYMSPEQKKPPYEATYASDIYSLGVLSYELILGKLSYGVINITLLPKNLRKIINKALAVSITERYQTIDEFIDDISLYLKSNDIEKEKPGQDQTTEIVEIFQKASYALSPFPSPSWPPIDIGIAKIKSSQCFGLYYDVFVLPNECYFIFIADPFEQTLNSLFSTANLRGVVRTLIKNTDISVKSNFEPISFAQSLQKQMADDPFIINFTFSYLYLDHLRAEIHFFNAGLSNLIRVPAGEESHTLINKNALPASDSAAPFAETIENWNVGDILIYHSLYSEKKDSIEKQEQLDEQLKKTLKTEMFLSAQAQAEVLLKDSPQSKQARVLFSIQRVS